MGELILFIWIIFWIVMSYEDIRNREVSAIFLAIFFVSSIAFAIVKGILVKNAFDYLLSIIKVSLISGIQLVLGHEGIADFVFSLAAIQPVSVGTFKVRLMLGFLPTNLQFDTSLVEPIYINTCTTLLRIHLLRKLQSATNKRFIKIVAALLPFAWIFSVTLSEDKPKKHEVPFIPLFGILVLITSLAHIIVL